MRMKLAACLGVASIVVMPGTASAAKPASTCPPSFDLGLVTVEEDLQLPRTIAGIDAGELTVEEVVAFHELVDRAGDGLCFQTITPSGATPDEHSPWDYDYNIVDNNASVPT